MSNLKVWAIKECLERDPVSEMTLHFEPSPDGKGFHKLHLYSDHFPLFPNRTLFWNAKTGEFDGGGTGMTIGCRPPLREVAD